MAVLEFAGATWPHRSARLAMWRSGTIAITKPFDPRPQYRQHRLELFVVIHPAPHRRRAHRLRDLRVARRGDELLASRVFGETSHRRCILDSQEIAKPCNGCIEIGDDRFISPLQDARFEYVEVPTALLERLRIAACEPRQRGTHHPERGRAECL